MVVRARSAALLSISTLPKLSRKSDTTAAIRYALSRWDACGGIGRRKNYLFAGSDTGGERAAAIYSLIGSAKTQRLRPGSLPARGGRG
jgi:hypothetical protein